MKSIYLDYAAATPMDAAVQAAMRPYYSDIFYNPSATYLAGKRARRALEEARSSVARQLGAKASEITFTAGATEANNLAISGVMSQFPGGEVLTSAIEHESVLAPAAKFNQQKIPVNQHGIVELEKLNALINERTILISVMLVNNELGSLQPLRKISQLVAQANKTRLASGDKTPLFLHTDAAQAANYFDLQVSRLGVDMLTLNGGKIYGPKQTGVLYTHAGVVLQPQILGGGQEMGLRSGTENVAGAIGLAKALDLAAESRAQEVRRLRELRTLFISGIATSAQARVNGSAKHYSPHIIHLTFPGLDNERLMMRLDEAGIQVAVGSACSASKDQPSHVLSAIGMSDVDARSSLRLSLGRGSTEIELKKVLKSLRQLVAT